MVIEAQSALPMARFWGAGIDLSRHRHEVLIAVPGKQRRRKLTITNTIEDFWRLFSILTEFGLPVRIGFEGQIIGLAGTIAAP